MSSKKRSGAASQGQNLGNGLHSAQDASIKMMKHDSKMIELKYLSNDDNYFN